MNYPGRLLITAYDVMTNPIFLGPKPFTAAPYEGEYIFMTKRDVEIVNEDTEGNRSWFSQYYKLHDPIWFLNIIFTWQEGER